MKFKEAMDWIQSSEKFGLILGLDRMKYLMGNLDNPQNKLNIVHIAGTNGKGSVATYVTTILEEAGYTVGKYVSPELHSFRDRITIKDELIESEFITTITEKIKNISEKMAEELGEQATVFEITTAMAYEYFYEKHVDFAVMEVGLGGRFDATNVIDKPKVCAITKIDLDHIAILGDTLEKIAYEKAGIIKNGVPVISSPQEEEAFEVIEDVAKKNNTTVFQINKKDVASKEWGEDYQKFDYGDFKDLEISLLGEHQLENAGTAIEVIKELIAQGYNISESNIRAGLKNTKWKARLEILSKNPLILLDGAHNVGGITSLKNALDRHFNGKKFTFVTGILADKDFKNMLRMLTPYAKRWITITPPNPRALEASKLAEEIRKDTDVEVTALSDAAVSANVLNDMPEDLKVVFNKKEEPEYICMFGSLYSADVLRTWTLSL